MNGGNNIEVARCDWLLGAADLDEPQRRGEALELLAGARDRFTAQGMWIEAAMISCDEAAGELRRDQRLKGLNHLERVSMLVPADRGNTWVNDAVQALKDRFAADEPSELIAGLS